MDYFQQSTYTQPLGARNTISIESLKLIRVNGYQNQYLRPFRTVINGQTENNLSHLVNNYQGRIPSQLIANTCNELISPSDRVETQNMQPLNVTIPHGWQDNRYVFIMVIKSTTNGIEATELVTGYTDRRDISQGFNQGNGEIHLAPDTVFYINSVTKMSQRQVGQHVIPVIKDAYSVMGGGIGQGAYNNYNTYKMTPQNLLASYHVNMIDGLTDLPKNTITGSDHRYVSNIPSLVSRNYHSPTQMLSKVLEGTFVHSTMEYGINDMHPDDVLRNVSASMADPSVYHAAFLTALSNLGPGHVRTSTFTWKWLNELDPSVDFKTQISDEAYQTTQYSAPWDSPTLEAISAITVSTMVTSLMLKASLSFLEFSSTNNMGTALTGYKPETIVSGMLGFVSNLNFQALQFSTEQVINEELGALLSRNGEIAYSLYVRCDLNTDITIEIQFENNVREMFVFPSFADSSISPMLTTNTDLVRKNGRDIGTLIDTVKDNVDNQMLLNGQSPYPDTSAAFTNVNTQMGFGQNQPQNTGYTGSSNETQGKY